MTRPMNCAFQTGRAGPPARPSLGRLRSCGALLLTGALAGVGALCGAAATKPGTKPTANASKQDKQRINISLSASLASLCDSYGNDFTPRNARFARPFAARAGISRALPARRERRANARSHPDWMGPCLDD